MTQHADSIAGTDTAVDPSTAQHITSAFRELGLLSNGELSKITNLLSRQFPYAAVIRHADSIHLHVKVNDVDELPHAAITALGTQPVNATHGYVKYPFTGGINLIFSSIPIAEDDLVEGFPMPAKPFLDHAGIDLRDEREQVRDAARGIPALAEEHRWRYRSQGTLEDGSTVFCHNTQVTGKYWVYPPEDAHNVWSRPIEFAFGALKIYDSEQGCERRPMDPARPEADSAPSCSGT